MSFVKIIEGTMSIETTIKAPEFAFQCIELLGNRVFEDGMNCG
jgi:hypothetical protein